MPRRPSPTTLVLAVATVAVSTAAPLIEASEMPAIALAAWRTLLCAAVFAVARPRDLPALLRLSSGERRALVAGAALLAAHFALWISAFEHTSYASAVVLLVMQPVFGAVLGRLALREPVTGRMALAVAAAAGGLALLVHGDLGRPGGLYGDLLAVAGCLAIAVFLLVVRPLRAGFPFPAFMVGCYGLAGVFLAVLALATGVPLTGHSARGWWCVAGLVLVPTVVGHACFNWAVPRVRYFTLNLLIVLEPAIAILLGAAFLDETVTTWQLAGGGVLGLAVLAGLRRPARAAEVPPRTLVT